MHATHRVDTGIANYTRPANRARLNDSAIANKVVQGRHQALHEKTFDASTLEKRVEE